jgi:hypothetical protein
MNKNNTQIDTKNILFKIGLLAVEPALPSRSDALFRARLSLIFGVDPGAGARRGLWRAKDDDAADV